MSLKVSHSCSAVARAFMSGRVGVAHAQLAFHVSTSTRKTTTKISHWSCNLSWTSPSTSVIGASPLVNMPLWLSWYWIRIKMMLCLQGNKPGNGVYFIIMIGQDTPTTNFMMTQQLTDYVTSVAHVMRWVFHTILIKSECIAKVVVKSVAMSAVASITCSPPKPVNTLPPNNI